MLSEILPQLIKALLWFILTTLGQLLVFHINSRVFNGDFLYFSQSWSLQHEKWEDNLKYKERHYIIRKEEDIKYP